MFIMNTPLLMAFVIAVCILYFPIRNINFIPFLNTIDAPVVLIDDNNTYLSANNSALSIIDREHLQLQNQRTGDIFTCENSKLTGGCGHTDMCGGCQMLQLISKTYTAKNAFNNIPVTLTRAKGKVREKLNLHISTERMNNLVLLRIDQFDTKFEYQS